MCFSGGRACVGKAGLFVKSFWVVVSFVGDRCDLPILWLAPMITADGPTKMRVALARNVAARLGERVCIDRAFRNIVSWGEGFV